jgi:uncharacterized protein (UPF0332 family)
MDSIKIRQFRAEQSFEKLQVAKRLFSKEDYTNSLIQAFLSIFYSVRILLLEDGKDSDDFVKIVDLSRKYYEPSGWIDFDIASLLEEGQTIRSEIESASPPKVTRAEAEKFIASADKLYSDLVVMNNQAR